MKRSLSLLHCPESTGDGKSLGSLQTSQNDSDVVPLNDDKIATDVEYLKTLLDLNSSRCPDVNKSIDSNLRKLREHRANMVQLIIAASNFCGYAPQTWCTAITLLDGFLETHLALVQRAGPTSQALELAALACLLIASKAHEPVIHGIASLQALGVWGNPVPASTIQRFELELMRAVSFHLSPTTPATMLAVTLQCLAHAMGQEGQFLITEQEALLKIAHGVLAILLQHGLHEGVAVPGVAWACLERALGWWLESNAHHALPSLLPSLVTTAASILGSDHVTNGSRLARDIDCMLRPGVYSAPFSRPDTPLAAPRSHSPGTPSVLDGDFHVDSSGEMICTVGASQPCPVPQKRRRMDVMEMVDSSSFESAASTLAQ